ncbi:MAG: hypothetical protein JSW71_04225 [Gemmatimonadota bacterium]|nr:MAG: hypothetical protein JSW71_04225 [Gemmatimonadota bacterium]
MVSLVSLWLPILLGTVLVFIVSSIIHMVFKYHQNDYLKVPNEDAVRDAIRPLNIPPGDYVLPIPADAKDMGTPEYQNKVIEGPVVFMTVFPNQPFAMGKQLALWFIYSVIVSIFAGYLASRTLTAGEDYLQVFRVTGTVAFAGYGLALLQRSIWFGQSWSATAKSVFDALIYACFTAGAFGWLWP